MVIRSRDISKMNIKNIVYKRKIVNVLLSILLLFIFVFSVATLNNEEAVQTSSTASLSNTKIEWGIKRGDNHEQPDVGTENAKIMEEYGGIYLGNSEKKYIYLTFDNGYEAGYTEKILDILLENDVKACFFLTAHYINSQPDLVQRMIDEGHIIGNHTVNHYSMPELDNDTIKEEVMKLHTAVYEKFGYEMEYIRPPKGEYSERTIAYTNTLGYKTVMWSFAYDDWDEEDQGKEEYAKEKILENLHNGEVMLLHATSLDNSNILDECIKEIKAQGYEFRSLDEFEA